VLSLQLIPLHIHPNPVHRYSQLLFDVELRRQYVKISLGLFHFWNFQSGLSAYGFRAYIACGFAIYCEYQVLKKETFPVRNAEASVLKRPEIF